MRDDAVLGRALPLDRGLGLRWDRLGRLLGGRVQATPLLQNRFLGIGRYC